MLPLVWFHFGPDTMFTFGYINFHLDKFTVLSFQAIEVILDPVSHLLLCEFKKSNLQKWFSLCETSIIFWYFLFTSLFHSAHSILPSVILYLTWKVCFKTAYRPRGFDSFKSPSLMSESKVTPPLINNFYYSQNIWKEREEMVFIRSKSIFFSSSKQINKSPKQLSYKGRILDLGARPS